MGFIVVTISVQSADTSDFLSPNAVVSFSDGVNKAVANLFVVNDALPEGNETFSIVLMNPLFGADIRPESSMQLIISANDEPFGSVQFDSNSLEVSLSEPLTGTTDVVLTVSRGPGLFGRITVDYQLTSDSLGIGDLNPFQGQLVFEDQVSSQSLTLVVNPDNIPEPDETFAVQLISPTGGATLADNQTIAMVTIRENDSPVYWNQSTVVVVEDVGTFQVEIIRGRLDDGSTAGDISQVTTVLVSTMSDFASAGMDFVPVSTTLTFAPGTTSQFLSIGIIDDETAEGDETFTVVLSSPSSDAVLIPPSQLTVVIAINDNGGGIVAFSSPGPVIISEDGADVGMFEIQRLVGTFGALTIEWRITDNIDQSLASSDFQPPTGTVLIEDGASNGVLEIVALNDNLPEVAEGFMVQLLGVVSGDGVLNEMGISMASLIVTESDDVYGLVEWAEQSLFSVTNTNPRELQLAVVRSRGDIGTLAVTYTIVYMAPGSTEGDASVVAMATGSVQLQGGQVQREFSVTISDGAFLETGGTFVATLNSTSLIGGATLLISSMVSPTIGPRAEVVVEVPSAAANGYIGFELTSSLQVSVEEPLTTPTPVRLTVTRTGSYGLADVRWSVILLSADITDIGDSSGLISIPDSADTAVLDVLILPDSVPEIDELFQVTLVMTAQANQRIRPEQRSATVTIRQNDAAEGVFSISDATRGPYTLDESVNGIIFILIVREDGALTSEIISYSIPGGQNEFLGSQGLAVFAPQQREFPVTLLVNDDDIPETNETFQFEISALSGNSDLLSTPTSAAITILANDDYAGLFSFDTASLDQSIIEPKDSSTSTATFRVQRSRGTFTNVSVEWEVVSGGALDIQPTRGVVRFIEGQSSSTFEISALPDNLSEANETFSIRLGAVSGDGQLANTFIESQVTVLQNDDPINFQSSFLSSSEGETVMFTLQRGGQAKDVAVVLFTVDYQTATSDDVVVTPLGGTVTFEQGQSQAMITVGVVSDGVPEESELLVIRLLSTTGDAVIVSPTNSTLGIAPSDDPNGVFQFEMDSVQTMEGETLSLVVERLAGDFGQVIISWMAYQFNMSTGVREGGDVTDITPVANFITFDPGNSSAEIQFLVIDDVTPELEEQFEIQLTIPSTGGGSVNGARIGDVAVATVIVAPSDDPYGLLVLPIRSLELAEDVPVDMPSLRELSIPVRRDFGTVGEIRVTWEIVSRPLPLYSDLLTELVGSGVSTSSPRPDTGTVALSFSGQPGAIVSVPLENQPVGISSQVSISLWLKPISGTSGILVAQATDSSPIYRLSLIADSVNYIIRFAYFSETTGSLVSVETSVVQSSLSDGLWHSVVVSATSNTAVFYVDGSFLTSRILDSPVYSGNGELTVGGVSDSVSGSDFYGGELQDVRVFSTALSQSDVLALASDSAASSLTPVSGYITYPPGITVGTIRVTSKDDSIPEPSQEFVVQLANVVGGARIDPTQSSSTLTALKSDASNGVYGFNLSSVSITTTEGMELSLFVTRSEGLFGSVSLYWDVRQLMDGSIASMDFGPSSGQITFSEGQREGRIILASVDELIPELAEQFVVSLIIAVANDNQTSSTPLSGASIDPSRSQAMVTVAENDQPYGLFEIVTSRPLPGIAITPATTMPEVFVDESVGTVTVYVVRAQGVLGNASVEYITSEGSAVSGGGLPDFVPTAGSLSFSSDVIIQELALTILDNDIPELQKTFYINLTNPGGGMGTPNLGVGSALAIHIQPSDDAFGRFSFTLDSQARVVAEQPGGAPVVLTVIREGGMFGGVSLYWRVSQSQGSEVTDITPSSGTLEFNEGDTEADINLLVTDDLVAELDEVFTVQLVNVSVGASLGAVTMATITVEASDHPYGLFVFSPSLRPLTGVSEGQEVIVTVTRQFGVLGEVSVGVVSIETGDVLTDSRLSSLDINLQELGDSQLASTGLDYTPVNSTLTFSNGQTTASLSVQVLDDTLPELSEHLFLVLTYATLNPSSVETVDTSVLPTVATGNESIANIIIDENDNARGVVEFLQFSVTTDEPSQDFVSLVRRAGTFGEISVQWEVVPTTASTLDYTPVTGVVTFAPGVTDLPLPLTIVDDTEPEFAESLVVQLVTVTPPAQLGDTIVVMVTITANDDPNGALEFATSSLNVMVPEPTSSQTVVPFIVRRVGGTVGVVQLLWNVTNVDGSSASSDVLPTSGSLQFVSTVQEQTIQLSVLPDQLPEVTETFRISLQSVTGGARIIEENSQAILTIPENDGPFGVVSFSSPTSVAIETGQTGTSITLVPVVRSLGTFGDIRVVYSVHLADAADLALSDGTPLLDYYTTATPNQALGPTFTLQTLTGTVDVCARVCLGNQACRSLSVNIPSAGECQLYFSTPPGGASVIVSMGTDYYEKIEELTTPFYQAIASEGNDFSPAIGNSIVIPDGVAMAAIPVTIIGDSIPELNESLTIDLVDVELITSAIEGTSPVGEPVLGDISSTSLVILENDDPRGRFTIYGSNGLNVTRVNEPDGMSFGVSLTVERLGGSLGVVMVEWNVVNSTAVEGSDFTGSGALLIFADGELRSTVAIAILADDIPERDETIRVVLSNPVGGATIASNNEGETLIIIEANDAAAGVVGFDATSRSAVVGEGESMGVAVERTVSALGVVAVDWMLSSMDGVDPVNEFVSTSGTAVFAEGESTTEIVISVQDDSTPEITERYTLTLIETRTLSGNISPAGHATIDSQAAMATVTIRANNNPHGVVEFQAPFLPVRVRESDSVGQLIIVRQFGSFGEVLVNYTVEGGSVGVLTSNESLASPGIDFVSQVGVARLEDEQESAVVSVTLLDDADPELDEVFVVRLTSVTLVNETVDTIPPSIGVDSVREVIIEANDNPQGEMTFQQQVYEVSEEVGVFQLNISREQGLVGQVSVVYLVTNRLATNGQDFTVSQLDELVFVPGQAQRTVSIAINNDDIPETAEEFCVQLQLPRGGAVLGNITTTCVTISANDDAYGVYSFDSASLVVSLQETEFTTSASNVAELVVVRQAGLIGQVTVPFEVRAADGTLSTTDLSPLMGSALIFNPQDTFRIIQLEAVRDSIPELSETFTVTLLPPTEFGRLATANTMATVVVESNQDPYGVFQLSVVGGVTLVEEVSGRIDFLLTRSAGTFGKVSVTVETRDSSAVFSAGSTLSYAAIQGLPLVGAERLYSLRRESKRTLLVLGGQAESQLLAWRGVFTPVQTLPTTSGTAFNYFSPGPGVELLLVANGGFPGNRELTVDVYQFTGVETLTLLHTLPAVGVTDVISFSESGQWYVLVANGEDNQGNPIVDSTLWTWNGTSLVQVQMLPTIGASAVDTIVINGSLYVGVASLTDTRSQVYVWRQNELRLDHNLDSMSVMDISFLPTSPPVLALASLSGVTFHLWSPVTQLFTASSTLTTNRSVRLETSSDGQQLFVTNSLIAGQLFQFNAAASTYLEDVNVALPVSKHLYPFVLATDSAPYLGAVSAAEGSQSVIMEATLVDLSATDYFSRSLNLTFAPGESELGFSTVIVDDVTPEIDESFVVQLSEPVGGARLGQANNVTIVILTNDDAHGVIGFDVNSLSVIRSEVDSDSILVLDVIRMGGAFGFVSVLWEVTGDHTEGEIMPTQGLVVFPDGVTMATITLVIQPDMIPELNELTTVTLTAVLENGVTGGGDDSRGAQISASRSQATITVDANDAPHGVITWTPNIVMVTEDENVDISVELLLIREFGSIGAIVITYSTSVASSLPLEQQATEQLDFIPISSSQVAFGDGVTAGSVSVTIVHDNLAELTESFFVNITDVRLVNEADRQGSSSNSPRVGVEAVEVQIIENDNSRGVLVFAVTAVTAEEVIGGRVLLEVQREEGTFGSVGAEFTVVGLSASSADFSPSSGTVIFESGVGVAYVVIDIVNDPEAEFDESFEVTLSAGVGGALIGSPSMAVVTILSNDDISGVFSFTSSSLLFLIPESSGPSDSMGAASLTVQRTGNFMGVVTVYWEVEEAGQQDLDPVRGNLTFQETTREQMFQVRAVNDGFSELFEAFTVRLISADGGGRIVDPREARIAIQSSTDPSGIVGFVDYPQGIVVDEGVEIIVGVVRQSGSQGTVTLTWSISPPDTTVFLTTTDTLVLTDGQTEATFAIQTLSDTVPEVARLFSLDIISSSLASVDVDASHVDLIITSSNSPHGVVEFASSDVSLAEGNDNVAVGLVRTMGLIGDLRINFTIVLDTADQNDFTISGQSVMILTGQSSASLLLSAVDDSQPEVGEQFSIVISSVELLGNSGLDFDFRGDSSIIDDPPTAGSSAAVTVLILPSDNPFGAISFTQSVYNTREGMAANITLVRTGGTFSTATVMYSVESRLATSPADYISTAGVVIFAPGMTAASVLISIVDDSKPELEEDFVVTISDASVAALGSITMATVIISASDSPFGVVGFQESAAVNGIRLVNPSLTDGPTSVMLTVVRSGGVVGSTDITWSVTGQGTGEVPREDIAASTLSGVLILADGQSSGIIEVLVLPSNSDEVEESYVVTLQLASNNVFIDSDLSTVIITVAQMGTPLGVVSFIGDVVTGEQRVTEETTPSTLALPVVRTGGNTLSIMASYTVMRVESGDSPGVDVAPISGMVEVPVGIGQANLVLTILPDDISELDEVFEVTLNGTNAMGVSIDPLANTARFIISANDSPYGLFSLSVGANVVSADTIVSSITRSLAYTIDRDRGQVGDVAVTVAITYELNSAAVSSPMTTIVPAGTLRVPVSLPIAQDVYLYPGSEFNLTISDAVVTAPSEYSGLSGDISPTSGNVVGVVGEEFANPLVRFNQFSLSASVNDAVSENNVILTVERTGSLGTVDVLWSTSGSGSLTPPTGMVTLSTDPSSAQIFLTATPTVPHGLPEVFAVSLSVESRTLMFSAQVDTNADRAVIEPWGVIQLGGMDFVGLEGQTASVPVWRRYGSMGAITVTGVATVSSNIPNNYIAAQETVDFPTSPLSVAMGDGQTIGYINISLPNNLISSALKVFTFQLTAVSQATPTQAFSSPRLSSSNLVGQVTIVDDEGGAGLFSVIPNSVTAEEGSSVEFNVVRNSGSSGSVSVLVQTQVGGTAMNGSDYSPIDQVLLFADGESEKRLTVGITDDDLPEQEETFRVQLSVPDGGVALIDPVNGGLEVTIPPSDSPGGIFSISTISPLIISEDDRSSATVNVTRDPRAGLFGEVLINWEAVYTDTVNPVRVGISDILTSSSGSIIFLENQIRPVNDLLLSLQPDRVPEGGEQFVVRISSPTPGVVLQTRELAVTVQPRSVAVFQIRKEDVARVVTAAGLVTMAIQRVSGIQLSASVTYNTSSVDRLDKKVPQVGQLTFGLAKPAVHFAQIHDTVVGFEPGVTEQLVSLSVISPPTYPLAFFMNIGTQGQNVTAGEAVVVVLPAGTLSSLYSLYFDSLTISTPQELELVSSQLLSLLASGQVSGSNSNQSEAVSLTINQLITLTQSEPNIDDGTDYVNNMLDIFQSLLSDESFRGRSTFVASMKTFTYSLVQERACPPTNTEVATIVYSRPLFNLQAFKIQPMTLANRRFVSYSNIDGESEDYVQFPSQILNLAQTECVTVHFIELLSDQIYGQPTLRSKVMLLGVSDRNLQASLDNPVLLHLFSPQVLGIIPGKNHCIQWVYPTLDNTVGMWSSEFCTPDMEYSNVFVQNSVTCKCSQFGDLAVASDTPVGYRWTWPAGVSAAIVCVVMALVMILHLCYFSRTQLATRILVCLCLSVFLFQLILLIDIFGSSSPTLTDDGCVALGALLHFTIILQYVWILALAVALWVNFMGFTDGREPLIIYIIISWGLSIIVVVLTILIGRFAVPLSNTELYSHTAGDLCYMPLLSMSLLSTVLPVVVAMLGMVALLSHSCVYWSRWEDYHNMYHDSFNRTEIPVLLAFFGLIFFTSLAGYLHVYVTVVYTYAAFVALNVIQALFALIVYFFLSWHTLTRKHKKFIIGNEVEPLTVPEEPNFHGSMSSMSSSQRKMNPKDEWEEFEKDSDISYPVVSLGIQRHPSDSSFNYPPRSHSQNTEDSHLDDLMFMLKTQTYQSDTEPRDGLNASSSQEPKGAEHLELRRISIADTHL